VTKVRVDVKPKMFRFARERHGLTLADAAKAAGLKGKKPPEVYAERFARWETSGPVDEEDKPTLQQVRKFANKVKRPVVFFFFERPPKDEIDPADFEDYRSQRGDLSSALRYAIRSAWERREAALELVEDSDLAFPEVPTCRPSEPPQEVGLRVREWLSVTTPMQRRWGEDGYGEWKKRVSAQGVLVFEYEDVDVSEARGFALAEDRLPVVAINGRDDNRARSFSLLHEVAHVWLRSGRALSDDRIEDTNEVERFCNAVAGAALLPVSELLSVPEVAAAGPATVWGDDVSAVARRFGASRLATLRALYDAGKASGEAYWSLHRRTLKRYEDEKARERADRNRKQRETGEGTPFPPGRKALKRHGTLFARIVLDAVAEHRIPVATATTLLGVDSERLPAMHMDVVRVRV